MTAHHPLTWGRTWPDRQFDFSAVDGKIRVGRIARMSGGSSDRSWEWFMYAKVEDRHGTASGTADDLDDACREVEHAYREFRERIGKP